MDYINTLEEIEKKMKIQMHQKRIYSLDQVFLEIAKFDPTHQGYINKGKLELFLGKVGVFLKTQEISELLKYLNRDGEDVRFDLFIELFRKDPPKEILNELNEVFDVLSNGRQAIPLDELTSKIDGQYHPQYMIMNDPFMAKETVILGLKFVIGDKTEVTREEFIEFHKNIYCILPEDFDETFLRKTPQMWGLFNI